MSIGSVGITESSATREGIETIATKRRSESKHVMIKGKKPYTVKLIFRREDVG